MTDVGFTLVPGPDTSDIGDLRELETQLLAECSPPLAPDVVRRTILEIVASYQSAAVRTYLPLLIGRTAREQLSELITTQRS